MEPLTLEAIGKILNSFGAWGLCAVLLYKDIVLNKSLTDALNKFTVALNVFMGKRIDE